MSEITIPVARADFDEVTKEHSFIWAGEVISKAKEKYKVVDLPGDDAVPSKLRKAFEENKMAVLYFHYDHGSESVQWGQECRLVDLSNSGWLKGRICYSMSCSTAHDLGPNSVEKGCITYFGYYEPFEFWIHKDIYETAFKQSANQVAYSLIEDKTTKEAYDDTIAEFNKWIQRFKEDPPDTYAPYVIASLIRDRDLLRLLGSETIRVSEVPEPPPLPAPVCRIRSFFYRIFERLSVRLGKVVLKIGRKLVGTFFIASGLALIVHDFIKHAEVPYTPWTVHGVWWGVLAIFIGWLCFVWSELMRFYSFVRRIRLIIRRGS